MADPLDSAFSVYPVAGIPSGKVPRVDFRAGADEYTEFESLIENKTPRLAWARATICSCKGFNDQTDQTDPDCTACNGLGWRYFRPSEYAVDEDKLGELSTLQSAILEKANAVAIRGLFIGVSTQPDIFNVLGKWAMGSAMLTVRPDNRLGYYDRIVQLDELNPFSEVIEVGADGSLPTRYPVHSLNFAASVDAELSDDDLILYDDGTLGFQTGKTLASGTRLTLHYMHHPTWVVIEYAHATRTSTAKFKKANTATPAGDTQILPIRVIVRREYLSLDPEE